MNAPTSLLRIRVDDETRARAADALDSIGLSMSDAVRLFLQRVATDRAFPFELEVPNTETRAAFDEAEAIMRTRRGRFASAVELIADLEEAGVR